MLIGQTKENSKERLSNSGKSRITKKRFPRGHGSFLGPGEEEKKGMERTSTNLKVSGI